MHLKEKEMITKGLLIDKKMMNKIIILLRDLQRLDSSLPTLETRKRENPRIEEDSIMNQE
jgi:hypothetical protein